MSKKKLIFVNEALWIGGIETALVNLLNHLDYDKYDVTCLIIKDYTDMASRITAKCRLLVADRAHTVSFDEPYRHNRLFALMEEPKNRGIFRRLIWKGLCLTLRAPEMRLYTEYIRKQLKDEHFDTAVIYSDRTAEITVRGVNADKFLMFYHHGGMKKEYHDTIGYRKSEAVIAVSEGIAQQLSEYRAPYREKIVVINNITDYEEIRRKASESVDDLYPGQHFNIVSCGRLHPVKGYDLAIEACKKLVDAGYTDIRWHFIGDGPEKENLNNLTKNLDIEKYIHFYGMKNNPYPYIQAADLFVQSSHFEGYGLSLIESQVLQVPPISTEKSSNKLIDNYRTGILCDTSAESIFQTIAGLLADQNQLLEIKGNLAKINILQKNQQILDQLYKYF